jgi:predicted nucleic acid-binding protein
LIVVDASVVASAVSDNGADGDRARRRLDGDEDLLAPELLDLEVVSAIRSGLRAETLNKRQAQLALADLIDLDVKRVSHVPLLARIWSLRDNLTPYDAAYVALAEAFDVTLVTGDRRLSQAPGPRCLIEYLG